MKALVFDGSLRLAELAKPVPGPGEALIRVTGAGICNTDHEIVKGYVPGFNGVPGHEFVGILEEGGNPALKGKRVTGEINLPCGNCAYCKNGLERHCSRRTVVGIQNRPGAFAEFICLPEKNVVEIPPAIQDREALFIEPLAAALEILDQVEIQSEHEVLVFGDGKLGQLIARVMQTTGCGLKVVGKHKKKLALIKSLGISACHAASFQPVPSDIVIDATGSPEAFDTALKCVRPRGTLIIKSTFAGKIQWNPSRLVVDEITLVGSRCGQFSRALDFLLKEKPDFSPLIEATLPLDRGIEAFQLSKAGDSLKVLLNPNFRVKMR